MFVRMWRRLRRRSRIAWLGVAVLVIAGLALPEHLTIPVANASPADWNEDTFWYEPWGASGVHKGIDIFAPAGQPVIAASTGLVIFSGELGAGGQVIAVLGAKWRIHYYAHLSRRDVGAGALVRRDYTIGAVGDSGNAAGKPAHLHYTILSLIPYPWLATTESQGWKRMFYLDPNKMLRAAHD